MSRNSHSRPLTAAHLGAEAEIVMAGDHNARGSGKLAMAVLFAGLTAAPALALDVPLPTPRPPVNIHPNVTGSIAAPVAKPSTAAVRAAAQAPAAQPAPPPPNPISNPFAALLGNPGATTALKPEQRAIIQRVDDYLSGTQTLTGNFVQIGPDGRRTQGEFSLQKPGKVRFDYDPPTQIELIADGQSVVVRDRRLATQDVYPLSQTPLRFLLSDKVDLMRDTNLVAVYADDVFITVVVEEKNGIVGTSRLMIMFSAKDMQLKQWTVTDPQGYDTTVAVYNLDTTKRLDPNMFRIDYARYPSTPN
jgi:outer membrane lipoprotein-sorting protein